ncbi:hypothetical protein FSARC_9621 [Fusarium sarcochroum]|uniref:Nucleoside phosphorylase domain-containing protein n=1 Tax=Fusarium sarcochroum TaxID=1208366 RepID=A0A8H4TQJ4_9HYPO|nr:hypothetical protein FSARC_9621 [Fusarium sarcochroum]
MLDGKDVTVGYVCADIPMLTSCGVSLDQEFDDLFIKPQHDHNCYTLGMIGESHVAICGGLEDATSMVTAATAMMHTFPTIKRLMILSSKAGAVPSDHWQVRVGDVVVPRKLVTKDRNGGSIEVNLVKAVSFTQPWSLEEDIKTLIARSDKWGLKLGRPTGDELDELDKIFVHQDTSSVHLDGVVISEGSCPENTDYRDSVLAPLGLNSVVCFDDGHTANLPYHRQNVDVVSVLGISRYCNENAPAARHIWQNYASVATAACARRIVLESDFDHLDFPSHQPVDETEKQEDSSIVADCSASCGDIATPSTSADTYTIPLSFRHSAGASLQTRIESGVALPFPTGTPTPPEPAVLLAEIQQAAQDVSQLVGRFGFKMGKTLQTPRIKAAIFKDQEKLRLQSLIYADNFTCQFSSRFGQPRSSSNIEAPLLWWLWDSLLEWFTPTCGPKESTLDLTPAYRTDIDLPYKIRLRTWSNGSGKGSIELVATYGGMFMERRTFDAAIEEFRFPKTGFHGITAALAIDEPPYESDGCYEHVFDYLMPRPGSIWRSAMNISDENEKSLVENLAQTCRADDDYMYVSEEQDLQCKNLVRRFPPVARHFVDQKQLIGKKFGSYSRGINGPPGPKD